ncbi:11198_t:CDS:10 [Entrophospora sp. SA101]|nr:742_t:CDS:10 [Entrophospora sp. SA101]CAJ0917921.1 11187_t:CDS:10 [Entrophospora sp. SA101]CAJ0917946.1 11198_t:CDS:10 [Entrophospora sp. SA101]
MNNKKKIELQDLLGAIQEETGFSGLKQKLASLESGGNKGTYKDPLPPPLPKRLKDRLNRQAAYEETKKEISKWEPIVKQNRIADHLVFPIDAIPQHRPTNSLLAGTFKPSTNLEKEVESILVESGLKQGNEKELQQYEKLQLNKLSIDEIKTRTKELRRMRELMFREEIKAKRIAKIKSKTYRKIRRKEKIKLNLDQLSQLDPELAREERIKLDTARAKERMTLKHKNTTKWAKQLLKNGHHDPETIKDDAFDELSQLVNDEALKDETSLGIMESITFVGNNMGRMIIGAGTKNQLLKKQENTKVLFDQGPTIKKLPKSIFDGEINPWLQTDTSQVMAISKKNNKVTNKKNETKSDKLVNKLKRQKQSRKEDDVEIDLDNVLTFNESLQKIEKQTKVVKITDKEIEEVDVEEDEKITNDYIHSKDTLKFTQRELVSRAFANDNVVQEFEVEKQAIIDEDAPKEEDITLPGWGAWGGKGVRKRKRRKLISTIPGIDSSKRKDSKLKHVVINEKRVKKAKKYLSTNVPYPFKNTNQYEHSLHTPLGKEWNTVEVYQKLNKPRVITKLGSIIDPLNVPFKNDNKLNI